MILIRKREKLKEEKREIRKEYEFFGKFNGDMSSFIFQGPCLTKFSVNGSFRINFVSFSSRSVEYLEPEETKCN